MVTAIFFLDPLLSFYPSQFFPNITMSSTVADDGIALPPSRGRKTPPNGSRTEHILSSVQSTPLSNHAPAVDPAATANHLAAHFDRYIEEDLRERVFVHAEHFFPTILHLPREWKTDDEIIKKIKAIRDDPVFTQHMKTYVDLCNQRNPGEKTFYHPYWRANDHSGLGVYRQDAKPVIGSNAELVPDTIMGPSITFLGRRQCIGRNFKTKVSLLDEGTEVRYRILSSGERDLFFRYVSPTN
ncbi:hypothetical protein IW261DRAFT_1480938 [Armillaria novae-zelandiae]|uniref:Uncharacterized protein n=1 Tax=Armillaria novae-zelandiae TaxID=153914 RepID=A0AA39P736_9AGAR|nr:hypothetical protein IW261DRAFT_1480938 [Armillaria novae-zelandiae]